MNQPAKSAASMKKLTAEQKLAKSERHDAEYMKIRKATEAANIQKTLKLRALRLAMEQEKARVAEEEKKAKGETAAATKPRKRRPAAEAASQPE